MVVVVVAIAALTRRSERRALLAALAVVIALAAVVPAPWYAHQLATYDSALFGQPHPSEPVWSRRPLGFFVGAGLPEVVTEPYRPSFSRQFLPIAYAETSASGHVRVRLRAGDGAFLPAIAFRAAGEPLGRALLDNRGQPMHIAGTRWRHRSRARPTQ